MNENAGKPRSMWSPWHFLLSAGLGLATAIALPLVSAVAGHLVLAVDEKGGGICFCAYFLAFPAAGALIGWMVPRGLPGASVVMAVFIAATLPTGIGPTSKTMIPIFACIKGLGMFIGEAVAATIRLTRERKARQEKLSALLR